MILHKLLHFCVSLELTSGDDVSVSVLVMLVASGVGVGVECRQITQHPIR